MDKPKPPPNITGYVPQKPTFTPRPPRGGSGVTPAQDDKTKATIQRLTREVGQLRAAERERTKTQGGLQMVGEIKYLKGRITQLEGLLNDAKVQKPLPEQLDAMRSIRAVLAGPGGPAATLGLIAPVLKLNEYLKAIDVYEASKKAVVNAVPPGP